MIMDRKQKPSYKYPNQNKIVTPKTRISDTERIWRKIRWK